MTASGERLAMALKSFEAARQFRQRAESTVARARQMEADARTEVSLAKTAVEVEESWPHPSLVGVGRG